MASEDDENLKKMRLETEVEELQLETEGSTQEIKSKVIHTRAFLLSLKDSAVCKRLPTGCELSLLQELLITEDSDGDPPVSDGRWDNNLEKKESHSRNHFCSDSWRQECLSQCLSKAPGCASCSTGPMIQKDDAFQLTKSKNPYRPPHSYKVGDAKVEGSSKSNSLGETDCNSREETHSEKHNIAQQPETNDSSEPVPTETKKTENLSPFDDTSDKFPDKANASIIVGATNNEHCRTILNKHVGISLINKSNVGSFADVEKAIPLPLAAPCESKVGDSGSPLLSVQASTVNAEPSQGLQPIPERKELSLYKTPSPIQRGPFYTVSRSNTPETCGFPLVYAGGDFLNSLIGECGINESDHDDLQYSDLDKIEESQSTFDNFWAEISAILRSEQELELTPEATNKDAVDSDVHICFPEENSLISFDYGINSEMDTTPTAVNSEANICLPDEHSLISTDYLIESSNSNSAGSYIDIADSEAEISLPEEDSLITVEDLIAPRCSIYAQSESSAKVNPSKSNMELNVSKSFAGLDVASAKVPPFVNIGGSVTQQKLHSSQSYPQNLCTGFSSQRSSRDCFMDPKSNADLYCNSCTWGNPVHSWRIATPPKSANFDGLVQYSVMQQPTNFSPHTGAILNSSGVNCVGMQNQGPSLLPMLSYPPGVVGGFNDQMPFYRCMDMEQGARLPWPGGAQ